MSTQRYTVVEKQWVVDQGMQYSVGISNRLVAGSMPRNDWVELFPRMCLKRDKNVCDVCMSVYGGGRGGVEGLSHESGGVSS